MPTISPELAKNCTMGASVHHTRVQQLAEAGYEIEDKDGDVWFGCPGFLGYRTLQGTVVSPAYPSRAHGPFTIVTVHAAQPPAAEPAFATKAAAFAWLGQNPGRVVRAADSYHFAYSEERGLVRCVMSADADHTVADRVDGAEAWALTRAPFTALPPPAPPPAKDAEILQWLGDPVKAEAGYMADDATDPFLFIAGVIRTRRIPK